MKGGDLSMHYKFFLAVLGLALIAGLTDTQAAEAHVLGGMEPLVQKIADRFHLPKADVQAVFDEAKTEHMANDAQKMTEQLDQAVTDGHLTADQAALVVQKRAELMAAREAIKADLKNLTLEERRAMLKKQREDLKTWAETNGIDRHYLLPRLNGPHPDRGLRHSMESGTSS